MKWELLTPLTVTILRKSIKVFLNLACVLHIWTSLIREKSTEDTSKKTKQECQIGIYIPYNMKLLLYNLCAFMYYLLMIASISTWMNTKQIVMKIIQLVGYHSCLRWLSWGKIFLTSRQTVMELYELWTNLRTHNEVNLSCVLYCMRPNFCKLMEQNEVCYHIKSFCPIIY